MSDRIKQFLKKDKEIKISQNPQEFVKQKLVEQPKIQNQKPFIRNLRNYIHNYRYKFHKFRKGPLKMFMRDTFPTAIFLCFSCYMMWLMQDQLDNLTRKHQRDLSHKQELIESENEEIQKYLMRNPTDVQVPIKDSFRRTNSYRFENYGDDSNDFDTKEDMLEAMRGDIQTPDKFETDIFDNLNKQYTGQLDSVGFTKTGIVK